MAAALEVSNPALYRNLALYLQVLRQVLPGRVEQACFHLATQVHPQRYAAMAVTERTALHGRILALVKRCSTLLTVEQLTALADQLDRESQHRQRRQQRELLEQLHKGSAEPLESEGALPAGSIQLDFSLPLSADIGSWRAIGSKEPELAGFELLIEPEDHNDSSRPDDADIDGAADEPPGESLQQRLAQGPDGAAILKMVRETLGDPEESRQRQLSAQPPPVPSSPWREAKLPCNPVTLLIRLDGLEAALLRRLRNLSHALNVELMRAGISGGLLPVSLLDAVLAGQVETMASPSNVLHLQLPFSLRPGLSELHALAILLQPVDLEMEEPRLRTCRRRLQQQRQELRRMAHQFRRLQRRLQSHEAEGLWLQDIRNSQSPQA